MVRAVRPQETGGAGIVIPPRRSPASAAAEASALMEMIAAKLLAGISGVPAAALLPWPARRSENSDVHGRQPATHPQDTPAAPWEEPPPALTDFNLRDKEGRIGFLYALFMHHYRHGLLLAVNHVWASLARPKAVRCQIMAQALNLPGAGKVALKNVLAAFLEEALYGVEFPPLPNIRDYPDSATWNAACTRHFDSINAKFDAIYRRYEAILDGRDPDGGNETADVIMGPWIAKLAHATGDRLRD